MRLLYICLLVLAVSAVADAAKKRKGGGGRDRDREDSAVANHEDGKGGSREESSVMGKKKDEKKKEKEEKPLKKAEDESSSSSSEEDDKKEEEEKKEDGNKTVVIPPNNKSRARRDHKVQGTNDSDGEILLKKNTELNHAPFTPVERAEPVNKGEKRVEMLRRRRAHDHTHERDMADHTHSKDREGAAVLPLSAEMNDGVQKPLDKQPTQSQSRNRRHEGHHHNVDHASSHTSHDAAKDGPNQSPVLKRAQELNDGVKLGLDGKPVQRRRRDHGNKAGDVSKSEEDTIKRATELNDGEQRPLDNAPAKDNMYNDKKKSHRKRHIARSPSDGWTAKHHTKFEAYPESDAKKKREKFSKKQNGHRKSDSYKILKRALEENSESNF